MLPVPIGQMQTFKVNVDSRFVFFYKSAKFSLDTPSSYLDFSMSNEATHSIVQALSGTVRGIDSSRQLALGVSIGMMIGFVPKDNLIFLALLVLLIVSGANLVTGVVSAIVGSLLSIQLYEVFHFAGTQILSTEFVSTLVGKALHIPLVAWTEIDNTYVCGSFFLGLALLVPVYVISFGLFHHFRSKLKSLFRANVLNSVTGLASK